MTLLTNQDIYKLVNHYIGVSGGYLGDFSYRTHAEFYHEFCDLDINPNDYPGTTRERFITILKQNPPNVQAIIIRGILEKYPAGSSNIRTKELHQTFTLLAARLAGVPTIATPNLIITSDVVERAIKDAEMLVQTSGATSGVDRIHTALHGYLIAVCADARITHSADASINELFKALKAQHPALNGFGSRAEEVTKIIRGFGGILDTLNPIRNHASVAHPNNELLEQDEAVLVINAARTILHYLNAKFSKFLKMKIEDEMPF